MDRELLRQRQPYPVLAVSLSCVRLALSDRRTSQYQRESELLYHPRGWSGPAMVLGNFQCQRRPTNLDNSKTKTYCAFVGEVQIFFCSLMYGISCIFLLPGLVG